jgi:KaiC/GvpD/RAD55 family RecA-like ATPase
MNFLDALDITQAEARAADACENLLRAILAEPVKAFGSPLVPADDFVATMDAVRVYSAVLAAVTAGKAPTPFALRVQLEESGFEPSLMSPYLGASPGGLAEAAEGALRAVAARKSQKLAGDIQRAADKGQLGIVSSKAAEAVSLASREGVKEVGARDFLESSIKTFFETPRAMDFGWVELDTVCRVYAGDLVIVAADTGIGKSSFILQMMIYNARKGVRSTYLSCEDSVDVFGSRFLAAAGGIDRRKFVKGVMTSEDARNMSRVASDALLLENVKYVDCTSASVDQICAQIRQATSRGSKFVAVDYFQAISIDGKFGSDVERKNAALERIITATKQTGVVCVMASQVRRAPAAATKPGEAEVAREPKPEDLLGTGNLARRAQVIVTLWGKRGGTLNCRLAKSKTTSLGNVFELVPDEVSGVLRSREAASPLGDIGPWGRGTDA